MALRAGAILDAGGATFIVRGWWMIVWDWRDVMELYGLVWYITTLVSCAAAPSSLRTVKPTDHTSSGGSGEICKGIG